MVDHREAPLGCGDHVRADRCEGAPGATVRPSSLAAVRAGSSGPFVTSRPSARKVSTRTGHRSPGPHGVRVPHGAAIRSVCAMSISSLVRLPSPWSQRVAQHGTRAAQCSLGTPLQQTHAPTQRISAGAGLLGHQLKRLLRRLEVAVWTIRERTQDLKVPPPWACGAGHALPRRSKSAGQFVG